MTREAIIRRASLCGLDLNVRDGQLFAHLRTPIPDDVLADVNTHKPAIIEALTTLATCAGYRVALARCAPLTPDDLTGNERHEAETLAGELSITGGLGQFVLDYRHTWNQLSDHDRVAAALCWQLTVSHPITESEAA
jgi:hypothetical protein